jgi:microcystin-dependent protein
MSSPFVAEIRIWACNFAPTGWAQCNGQLLPISQNTALFSLLGTMYGGDGKSNFALPNFEGSVPMFWGQGPGLSLYDEGQSGGSDTITLIDSEMPSHTHSLNAKNTVADSALPTTNTIARYTANAYKQPPSGNVTNMAFQSLPVQGGSQPHNNMQPFLTLEFCIALQGVFPPRG